MTQAKAGMIRTPQEVLLRRVRTKTEAAEPFKNTISYVAWSR